MTPNTNDYRTQIVTVTSLSSTDVLVGESGGPSAIYDASPSYAMMNPCQAVETEHDTLYFNPLDEVVVLRREGQ